MDTYTDVRHYAQHNNSNAEINRAIQSTTKRATVTLRNVNARRLENVRKGCVKTLTTRNDIREAHVPACLKCETPLRLRGLYLLDHVRNMVLVHDLATEKGAFASFRHRSNR